ncbi:CDT1-like protein a, chloroplastic isoform X2 [Mangifera indica]|uniref:CDT1-like protein a, chloroplastic isoform X2 n=1 Tax=Mangifera indica TaxID=29780 RepID=UPI001CF9D76A|nr:CDT1-like protein a, chloroplastic isoform X2 [Mangifera indica]
MSSSDTSQSIPFKSKKPLHFKPKVETSNPKPLTTKTPEKPSPFLRRARNSGVALSVKEVRKAAQTRTRSQPQLTDEIESAKQQIGSWPTKQSPVKSAHGSNKLPEKYRQLAEFFDSLDSAIRLLKLKRSMSTFTNICPKIECLTDRRFSHGHLAQLKFILPEAIEIKKVLMFDEKTSCMKPDLHVTINVDAVECDGRSKSDSKNMDVRKVFRARLMDFIKGHPEGDEVPEEALPEPFNRPMINVHSAYNEISIPSSSEQKQAISAIYSKDMPLKVIKAPGMSLGVETSRVITNQQPIVASHLSQSFRRQFSKPLTNNDADQTDVQQKLSKTSDETLIVPVLEPCIDNISPSEETKGPLPATPMKVTDTVECKDDSLINIDGLQSTPAKLASTPARLMSSTPSLSTPKRRCYMTPEDVSASTPNKLVRRPQRSRSLKFDTPVKEKVNDEDNEIEGASVDDDILGILPENLIQSIREKERKTMEERDPAISQAKRRRQMIACLPKLFNMIHYLFQSIKRSVITKEELIYKIISSHCDIVDKREVEEQMSLLLELVPEWISEKVASSGDLLVCINKLSSPETIRAQLEEAK